MFLAANDDDFMRRLISAKAFQVLIISLSAMFMAQIIKFIIYSIRTKKSQWRMLISTGGMPSSHTAFVIALTISLGMIQFRTGSGTIDWSFTVAVVFSCIVIHDAMGVRLEASKHAKILNRLAEYMTEEEKQEIGYGKKGVLKEMLGHKGSEVIGGVIVGVIVGLIGFFIVMNI